MANAGFQPLSAIHFLGFVAGFPEAVGGKDEYLSGLQIFNGLLGKWVVGIDAERQARPFKLGKAVFFGVVEQTGVMTGPNPVGPIRPVIKSKIEQGHKATGMVHIFGQMTIHSGYDVNHRPGLRGTHTQKAPGTCHQQRRIDPMTGDIAHHHRKPVTVPGIEQIIEIVAAHFLAGLVAAGDIESGNIGRS